MKISDEELINKVIHQTKNGELYWEELGSRFTVKPIPRKNVKYIFYKNIFGFVFHVVQEYNYLDSDMFDLHIDKHQGRELFDEIISTIQHKKSAGKELLIRSLLKDRNEN